MLSSSNCARRVALHGYGDKMIEHACSKKIRSLINFKDVSNLSRFRMLRVLYMSRVEDSQYLHERNYLKGLNNLTALKYFGLEGDYFSIWDCEFPTVRFFKRSPLNNMKNLQTVRTWFCKSYGELAPSFWGNKQLRHINFSGCYNCEADPEGPPSAVELQSLLYLKGVKARQDWVVELPNFPNIRKLGIVIPENVAGKPLINMLSKLNYLRSLHLTNRGDKPITFPDCISAFKNHHRLHSFSLWRGRWPRREVVDRNLFPPHLVKLNLKRFDFEDDPMPQLEKLPNLKVLKLLRGLIEEADREVPMICSRGGFGCLQQLVLEVEDLEEWKIEEGALPMLNQLVLTSWELQRIPDLQYLINLQEFTVYSSDQVKSRLQGQDQWKIKHIPSVKIR